MLELNQHNGVLTRPCNGRVYLFANRAYKWGACARRQAEPIELPSPPLSDLWCQNLVSNQAVRPYEGQMGADPFGKLRPRIFP